MPKLKGRQPGFEMGAEHRTKIANSKILKHLIEFCEGTRDMEPHRAATSLGLLRKVMPDMSYSENNTTVDVSDLEALMTEIRNRGMTIHDERGSIQSHASKPH